MSIYKTMAMEMARYNKWQNSVLLDLCDTLTEEQLNEDHSTFFPSLLATLNHILHVDTVLMTFIKDGTPPVGFDPTVTLHDTYAAFKDARRALDDNIQTLMDRADPVWFDKIFEYHSDDRDGPRRRPRALFINQMFNHQTHHRAQATTILHRLGLDYGSTDMPYNPLSQS